MSSQESGVRIALTYSADVVLVAGNRSVAITDARFGSNLLPSSQFIGAVRKLAGGGVGAIKCMIASSATPPVQATTYSLNVNSTDATDTSTYTVYWRNELVALDPSANVFPC